MEKELNELLKALDAADYIIKWDADDHLKAIWMDSVLRQYRAYRSLAAQAAKK